MWLKSVKPTPTWKALQGALKANTVGEAELAEKGKQEILFLATYNNTSLHVQYVKGGAISISIGTASYLVYAT